MMGSSKPIIWRPCCPSFLVVHRFYAVPPGPMHFLCAERILVGIVGRQSIYVKRLTIVVRAYEHD